jgi:hypothetical protein
MSIENWLQVLGAFGVVLANAVFATWFVSNRDAVIEKTLREKIESCYNLAITKLEAVSEKESKARHDLANDMQRSIAGLALDDRDLGKRINELQADMVRKSDLSALEGRMTAILERLDGKVDELRDRVPNSPR